MAGKVSNSISPKRQAEYKRTYDRLMERARGRVYEKGVHERHHIQPRSLGGDDRKENIVCLTYREHFLAHWLLVKFTDSQNRRKMAFAFWRMVCNGRLHTARYISGWQYELVKTVAHQERKGYKQSKIFCENNSERMIAYLKTSKGKTQVRKAGKRSVELRIQKGENYFQTLEPEVHSEIAKKGYNSGLGRLTTEQRSANSAQGAQRLIELGKNYLVNCSLDQRIINGRKGAEALTFEQRSAAGKKGVLKMNLSLTKEQIFARAKKAAETRRRNKELRNQK